MPSSPGCSLGTVCDQTSGGCITLSCTGTGPGQCPSGDVCGNVNGNLVCTPNCSTTPNYTCPSGTQCDPSGVCSVGAAVGQSCTDSSMMGQSDCSSGFTCISLGTTNMCIVLNCFEDSQCGTNGI